MKIVYRTFNEYFPVDIQKLRPKGSYKNLVIKRTYAIKKIIKKHGRIPAKLLRLRSCPLCAVKDYEKIIKKDYLDIVKCQQCGMVFTNPIFKRKHYQKTYQTKEYQEIVKKLVIQSHEYRKQRFGRERIQIMQKFIKQKKVDFLDLGCSTGFVVEAAEESGWNAVGVDLNPSAIRFGQKKGLSIYQGNIFHPKLKDKKFDIISLFDVLEHLPFPKKTMGEVRKKLRKKGYVFLYVPNFDSASRMLMGKEAHFIWPSHHLNYFTPKTIVKFLKTLGFEIKFLTTEGLDLDDYIWYKEEIKNAGVDGLKEIKDQLQFFINSSLYGKNLRVLAQKNK